MNRFVILRVSVNAMSGGGAARQEKWDRAVVVGSADTLKACRALVADMQRGQTAWHYYGVELVLAGDPARRTPIVVKRRPTRRRSVAANSVEEENVFSLDDARHKKKGADVAP